MIKKAVVGDSKVVAELAMLLWPDNKIDNLEEISDDIISNSGAVFIYFDETVPVGFAQRGLKNDYFEEE